MSSRDLPFIFGAQYYRAPTPEPECWEADHRRMRELGFNSVKYWAQWRWSHKQDGSFDFSDLDGLMNLAQENDLQVTINTIFDVAPHWLYTRYPDAKQVCCDGRVVEPYTVAHRQIGGHPGPCYNHPGARLERERFLRACLEHFRSHPALKMWDAWNEPELCFPQRTPDVDAMACYCPHCQERFLGWLQAKYASLDHLNQVWGRCYESWEQVETPRNPHTITDYVDWREFHIATMTGEAAWRLALIRELDPGRIHYLHVVPNVMSVFNSVACCADDFELASHCQVFAATMNGGPVYAPQVLSAGRGKLCYNVESHINFGMTNLHQRRLSLGRPAARLAAPGRPGHSRLPVLAVPARSPRLRVPRLGRGRAGRQRQTGDARCARGHPQAGAIYRRVGELPTCPARDRHLKIAEK